MRRLLKSLVNGLLQPAGMEVRQIVDPLVGNPYLVQQKIITKTRPVIFDAGAHIGQVTARYRDLFPGAMIHAFEPFPESFEKLKASFQNDADVTCNASVVSDVNGLVEMNLNTASVTNSLLKTSPQGAATWGENMLTTCGVSQVPSTTVATYCERHAIEEIDILKLDVQGAELRVLQGTRALLEQGRIGLVYMELILGPTYQGQPSLSDYLHFFEEVGYTLLDVYNPERKGLQLIQWDIIWVPLKRSRGDVAE